GRGGACATPPAYQPNVCATTVPRIAPASSRSSARENDLAAVDSPRPRPYGGIHGRPWSIIALAALSHSSVTLSAAANLSMSRLYVAQRIRGGLSGYSSSVGSPTSLRRTCERAAGLCQT